MECENLTLDADCSTVGFSISPQTLLRRRIVRLALENAVSLAGVLLLAEATLTEGPEPKREIPSSAEEL